MKSTVIADIQWLDYVGAQKLNIRLNLTVKRVLKWSGVVIVVAIHNSTAVSVCRRGVAI